MSITLRTSSDDVVEVIFEAILKKRLNPGVKLSEISLQEEFGYSRTVIRQGFDRLVDSGVLIHKKNQSVRVACPTELETRQIYEARKAIETGVILILVEKYHNKQLDLTEIDSMVSEEKWLHDSAKLAKLTRLSCDFHLTLAESCDNKYLVESLKPLIPLSALAASVYADPESNFCSFAEHQELIEAIKSNNPKKASEAINIHFDHCVQSLNFGVQVKTKNSYSHIFN